MNEQTPGIIINNLTKKYGDFVAVNNISLITTQLASLHYQLYQKHTISYL